MNSPKELFSARAVLLQLLANPDPQMQAILAHPENTALIKRLIGLEEFVIPEEESRTKQYREIAQLVGESPVVKRDDGSGVELVHFDGAKDRASDDIVIHEMCR